MGLRFFSLRVGKSGGLGRKAAAEMPGAAWIYGVGLCPLLKKMPQENQHPNEPRCSNC